METTTANPDIETGEEISSQPFILNMVPRQTDSKYLPRLDKQTKMMRRLFEIMMLSGCGRLKTLDGLDVDRTVLDAKDDIWEALVMSGILRTEAYMTNEEITSGASGLPGNTGDTIHKHDSSGNIRASERWGAEDSFA